jgi:hypothetical protein
MTEPREPQTALPLSDERRAKFRDSLKYHLRELTSVDHQWLSNMHAEMSAEIDRLKAENAAERARISMIQSRLTQATDGTQCGTLHDVGSWHDWAERLLAEIADTGPAKGGT